LIILSLFFSIVDASDLDISLESSFALSDISLFSFLKSLFSSIYLFLVDAFSFISPEISDIDSSLFSDFNWSLSNPVLDFIKSTT